VCISNFTHYSSKESFLKFHILSATGMTFWMEKQTTENPIHTQHIKYRYTFTPQTLHSFVTAVKKSMSIVLIGYHYYTHLLNCNKQSLQFFLAYTDFNGHLIYFQNINFYLKESEIFSDSLFKRVIIVNFRLLCHKINSPQTNVRLRYETCMVNQALRI